MTFLHHSFARHRFSGIIPVLASLSLGCVSAFSAEKPGGGDQPAPEKLVISEKQSFSGLEKLKPDDKIAVSVFEEASLSLPLQVSQSGTINFPLLGQIPVKGLTPPEVAQEIKTRLEDGYLRNARVSVDLVGRKPCSVTVIGQVRAPRTIEFPAAAGIDLFTAIASAGGAVEETADKTKIEITRKSGESIKTIIANLERQKELALQDADTVIVNAKPAANLKLVTILGQVARPGTIQMFPDRDTDILSAIANAGGLGQMANAKRVKVTSQNGESREIRVDQMQQGAKPLILKPGDTVYVPETIF